MAFCIHNYGLAIRAVCDYVYTLQVATTNIITKQYQVPKTVGLQSPS